MSYSIYSAAYNLNKMTFDWKPVLENWCRFLGPQGEIVIAVNTSEDDTYDALLKHAWDLRTRYPSAVEWRIFKTDIPYTDRAFDGKIKDAALKMCRERYAILLDFDEVIPLWSRNAWASAVGQLEHNRYSYEALLIPSIDLFHDNHHMKSLGAKWYLHANSPHLGRGPVGFAKREDGTVDITKSDTTELIVTKTGELAKYVPVLEPRFSDDIRLDYLKMGHIPVVYHLGWLNKDQRLRQSAFWAPVWNLREGAEVETAKTMDDLNAVEYREHGLRHWNHE